VGFGDWEKVEEGDPGEIQGNKTKKGTKGLEHEASRAGSEDLVSTRSGLESFMGLDRHDGRIRIGGLYDPALWCKDDFLLMMKPEVWSGNVSGIFVGRWPVP
jgi:hypothetical protein